MLQAIDVSFSYKDSVDEILKKVNLKIDEASLTRIVGSNASGKTTLALILCGAIPHIIPGTLEGKILWDGQAITHDQVSELSSFLFQDPYLYFAGHTVEEELALAGYTCGSLPSDLAALLPAVPQSVPLHTLSGGEQQRMAIISALCRRNRLIILDEPFESLDQHARSVLGSLLKSKTKEGYVIIVIDRPRKRVEEFIQPDYNHILKLEDGILSRSDKVIVELDIAPIDLQPSREEPIIQTSHLTHYYQSRDKPALSDVSLEIKRRESIGLYGSNGSGKTTLLLLVAGLVSPRSGSINFDGKQVSPRILRKNVKMAFQSSDAQIFNPSVYEELKFSFNNTISEKSKVEKLIQQAAEILPYDLTRDPFSLSYGQKKLLILVTTFLLNPPVILLDEPSASLDQENLRILVNLAQSFLREGGTLITSSHDRYLLEVLCHRVIDIEDGCIVPGTPKR